MKYKNLYRKMANGLNRTANILLQLLPFVFLILLLVLGFFQHPAVDDFGVFNLVAKYGLWDAIAYFFREGDSRYFTMPVIFIVTASRFLLDHYYLVVIPLLIFSWAVVFYSVKQLASFYVFTGSWKKIAWLSTVLFLVFVSSVVQISSLLYWWSASLTYLLPFDLLLLYVIYFLKWVAAETPRRANRHFAYIIIFSFLLCGSNEELGFFTTAGIAAYIFYLWTGRKHVGWPIIILFLADCLFCLVLFFGPGNIKRAGGYMGDHQSLWYSLASAGYQSAEMFAYIFSNPFFWIAAGFLFFAYPYLKEAIKNKAGSGAKAAQELGVLFAVVVAYYFAARAFGGWVLHERANNAVILVTMVWLLVLVATNGPGMPMAPVEWVQARGIYVAKLGLLLFFLFNGFSQNLVKNVWSGYYHNEVLNERIAIISRAKQSGQHRAVIPDYNYSFDSLINARHSHKWAHFIKGKLVIPPPFLYFKDDPWSPAFDFHYAEYYGIDTLVVGNNKVIRLGLLGR